MDRPRFAPSDEARCPADRRWAAALGPALLAVTALGCGPRGYGADLVYAGTGSAQTTGEAAADLGHEEVGVRICRGVSRRFRDDPYSFAAITVGRACIIPADEAGGTVVGSPGSTCTLVVDGRVHRLRVTDATATFGAFASWTKTGLMRFVDRTGVQARIGGDETDEAGHVRHSLYLFEGPLARTTDARDWCVAMLPEPPPPAPAVRAPEEQTSEANSF